MGCAPSGVQRKNTVSPAADEVMSALSTETQIVGSHVAGEVDDEGDEAPTGFFKNKSKKKILEMLTELSKKALASGKLMDDDGHFFLETAHTIYVYNRAFFHMNNVKSATKDDAEKFRESVSQVALDTNFFHALTTVVKDLSERGSIICQEMFNCLFFTYCQSYSSAPFVDSVAKTSGFLETVKQILIDYKDQFLAEEDKLSFMAQLSEACLGILDYLAMKDQVARLSDLDLLETLKPYLASGISKHRLMTLMVVAVIISEDECEILTTQPDIIKYLLRDARDRLKSVTKLDGDFSCYECAFVIRQLARNDENKKLLVELGALPVLVKIGDASEDDIKEIYEVTHAIWALGFDKENAKIIANDRELGVVELLLKFKDSEDSRVRKACNGALWTLRDALLNSKVESYRQIGKKFEPSSHDKKNRPKTAVEQKGHIMISYQWADQPILKTIRDRLKTHNYKVWMDIDEMGGSTLQAMAEAVENASIVLMCMSQKYKNSSNCRAEAEYAFQKKKVIIPLKMERGYVPDGWLGFVCGAKVFFEFTDKYPFEVKMAGLLKEVAKVLNKPDNKEASTNDHPDGAIVPVVHKQIHAAPIVSPRHMEPASAAMTSHFRTGSVVDTVSGWSQSECSDWISKNDLKGCGLDQVGGKEVALLVSMWVRAPEAFYKCVRVTLKLTDLTSMAKLDFAIRQLLSENAQSTTKS